MSQNDLQKEYRQRLPSLFKQILMMYKDAPSNKSWVLEKLMEVFCKDIAHNIELLKAVDFSSFLNGFLEDDSVIHYPDFVMNNVSLMAAEVLSAHDDCAFLEASAFLIIRSPLQYWMVTKGHRVDVTFQIYKKWVQQRSMLHLLDGVQFDVAQALVHCLASPYNYTRQSAGDFVVELIKFTHNEIQEEAVNEGLGNIKSRLRSTISQLICRFNSVLVKSADIVWGVSHEVAISGPPEKFFSNYQQAAVNYCRLLSECAISSNEWCRSNSETEMFDQLVALLQVIASDNDVDKTDLFRPSTAMLVRLINYSSAVQDLKVKKLIKLLAHVSEIRNCSVSSDVVYVAGLILTQLNIEAEDQNLLIELSLLPLFVLFDVTPHSVLSTCPAAVETVKSFLKTAPKSQPPGLLKVAVDNLSNLANVQISKTGFGAFIDYLELRRMNSPTEVGLPILNGSIIRSGLFLNFLVLKLSNINLALSQSTDEKCPLDNVPASSLLDNVQVYTKACLNHSGISSGQIFAVMGCYPIVLKHLMKCGSCKTRTLPPTVEETGSIYNKQILQEVLQILQFKMFDLDPDVREAAVSATGDLFFVVHPSCSPLKSSVDMTASLSSLWQCVDNKIEAVATKVLEFLLRASLCGQLDVLLPLINITEADMITKIDNFLLSSPWDDIKPVAFNLLIRVCSQDMLVRYAEVCLQQDNVRLSLAVLDHIQDIFLSQQEDSFTLEKKVDAITSLLLQGWGDLILQKVNSADVCSFRKASSIMAKVLAFLEQPDVCGIIDNRISDFLFSIGMAQYQQCERSHSPFVKTCEKILRMLGHVELTQEKPTTTNNLSVVQEQANLATVNVMPVDITSAGHPHLTKKRKGSYITNGNEEIPSDKIQKYEASAKEEDKPSSLHLFCSLFDGTSTARDRQHKENSHCVSKGNKISDNDKLRLDVTKQNILSDDFYLDSTKEMPALILRTEPFPSQKMIQEMISRSDKCSDPTKLERAAGLMFWLVFQEMFRRIDPCSQQQEAQRSTDEYERNSLILLYDLEQVVARSFRLLQDQLEQELNRYFFSTFSSSIKLSLDIADTRSRGQVLKELINHERFMMLIQNEEENVVKFILQKRRSVLKSFVKNGEFILDQFLERLHYLSSQGSRGYIQEFFASSDGLKALLQLYMNENINYKMVHNSLKSNSSAEIVQKLAESGQDLLTNIVNETAILEADDISFLNIILTDEMEGLQTIQARVKTLISSSRRNTFQRVLQLHQSLTKLLIRVVCGRGQVERCSNIAACFGQLESWYLAEDDEYDSHGDDDPTAIDCF